MVKQYDYVLYVSFLLDVSTMIEDTAALEKLVGKDMTSGDTGFGYRIVEFVFDDRDKRDEAAGRVRRDAKYEISLGNYNKTDGDVVMDDE